MFNIADFRACQWDFYRIIVFIMALPVSSESLLWKLLNVKEPLTRNKRYIRNN